MNQAALQSCRVLDRSTGRSVVSVIGWVRVASCVVIVVASSRWNVVDGTSVRPSKAVPVGGHP
jgi:hypothetical protein